MFVFVFLDVNLPPLSKLYNQYSLRRFLSKLENLTVLYSVHKKVAVVQLVKNVPASYETLCSITDFTSAHNWTFY